MKLYLAGNFPIMGNIKKEKSLYYRLGSGYFRLGSFFFKQTRVLVKVRKIIKRIEGRK